MTNVLFLGDTHGNRGFTKSAIKWASENDIDRIVQVGDFGFWARTNSGQKFLHDVGKASVIAHIPLHFIDGNHEDHTYLDALRERGSGMIHYGKYPITYIDRGTTWEWGGVKFGAFGGAYSIDRRGRIEGSPHYGWFANEMPDRSKIEALGQVDILVTHDSPTIPPPAYEWAGFKDDVNSRESQAAVYAAVVASQPTWLVHGHWHMRYDNLVADTKVVGLAHDGDCLAAACVVYSTELRKMFSLQQWDYRDGS